MPPGWHFKGLYLASRPAHHRKPGYWYAQASGPDPFRAGTSYGLTSEGRQGFEGAGDALFKLAGRLEDVLLDFEDVEAAGVAQPHATPANS